jgi:hypothetical protein
LFQKKKRRLFLVGDAFTDPADCAEFLGTTDPPLFVHNGPPVVHHGLWHEEERVAREKCEMPTQIRYSFAIFTTNSGVEVSLRIL